MPHEQERLDLKSLNEDVKRHLIERLNSLQHMLEMFPEAPADDGPERDLLTNAETWARDATVAIFNIFNLLAKVPYRTRQMDRAVEQVKRAFHAVFELVFSTRRSPPAEDFQRARSAVEDLLITCRRLV